MFSQVKLAFYLLGKHLLSAVLQAAGTSDSLDGSVTLYLNFGVLFPAADVHWHIIKSNFFLQEFVHLTLNGVFIASLYKRSSVVNASHGVEVFVLTRMHSTASEVIVEQVLTMATIWHTIINE